MLRPIVGGCLWAALSLALPAHAQISGSTRVASNLDQPIFAAHAPGDASRLFIAQKGGAIRILDLTTGNMLPDNFLNPISDINPANEGGLLGLAFHPDYATNGKFYVNVTRTNGGQTFQGSDPVVNMSTHILEYEVSGSNPNVAIESPREILSFVQPQTNHNGGWIGFSPNDGYLYVATGDGGGANDFDTDGGHTPNIGNAQDLVLDDDAGRPARNLHGKMLRIDVDGDDFPTETSRNYAIPTGNPFANNATPLDDEIWSFGLRNPFRSSFDRATGDLWIGDVGQNRREEINSQPASSVGGENYGWRLREGDIETPDVGGDEPANYAAPVYDYTRGSGEFQGQSVTGGVVYRGPDPMLRGQYLFGDYVRNNNWMFDPNDPDGTVSNINSQLTPNVGSIGNMVAYGEDADGNVYIVDLFGEVFRIDTAIQLPGDYDGSGLVDADDYDMWKNTFGGVGSFAADGNGNGTVDLADYTVWRDNLGRQFPSASYAGAVSSPTSHPTSSNSPKPSVRTCTRPLE